MTDKNTQEQKQRIIHETVEEFYALATSDFLIGHQFRKIQAYESINPLRPPLEAFRHHLPRINEFWELQLLGLRPQGGVQAVDLIGVHKKLQIRKGELGRWVKLFEEILEQKTTKYPDYQEFIKEWHTKIKLFEQRFLKTPSLFSQVPD
jgi:hypothetical protein